MKEKNNVLRIFNETKKAVKENNPGKIKSLSNQTINTASFTQDPDNLAVAVIVYSISKILIRKKDEQSKAFEKFKKRIIDLINLIIEDLEKKKNKKLTEDLKNLRKKIEDFSKDLKFNIKDVLRKASINKASRLYEHGVSMEKTAELLGITMYELANYIGSKNTEEYPEAKTINTKSRIKLIENFFEIK